MARYVCVRQFSSELRDCTIVLKLLLLGTVCMPSEKGHVLDTTTNLVNTILGVTMVALPYSLKGNCLAYDLHK